MKKLLLLTLATLAIISCKEEVEKPVKDYLVIAGKVKNFRKKDVTLKGFGYEKKIKFNKKTKTFKDTLRGIKAGHYTLIAGKRQVPIYLSDTTDLKMIVDAKKRTVDPLFKGGDAKINKYLVKRRKKFGVVLGNANKLFSSEEDSFLDKMEKYKATLEKLATTSKLPADYLEAEKRNINYEFVRNLNNYEEFHRILTGDDEFEVSEEFPSNEVKKVDFNIADDYKNSFSYRMLLKEYLKNLATKNMAEDGDYDLTYIETINSKIKNKTIKNDLLYQIAQQSITFTTDLPQFYKKFMAYSTDKKNNAEISDLYKKLKLTSKGMPSPKFSGYTDYNGGKISLDDLLNKDKYLYIDLWATWCGFCKKEIPLLKNFEQKYHGKKIEFVSINVDNPQNIELWKKTVKDKEMGGVQLFAGKAHTKLPFAQKYLIKGLPRFILLNPDGTIITPNAPRPSEGYKLDEIIESLDI